MTILWSPCSAAAVAQVCSSESVGPGGAQGMDLLIQPNPKDLKLNVQYIQNQLDSN